MSTVADHSKLSHRPSIIRSVAWNYLGTGYEALVGLLLIGYITRRIAVAEYGLLLLAASLCSLMYLLDLGLSNLLVQAYVAAARDSRQKLTNLLSTAFIALTALGTFGLLVFVAIAWNLPGPFKIPHQYVGEASKIFILIAISTQLAMPAIALENLYQAFHRFDRLNQAQFVTATVRIVLTILLLAAGYGVVALALVQTLLSLLRLLILCAAMRQSIPEEVHLNFRSFDRGLLRSMLNPGGWAVLDNSMRQLASVSDSFILGVFGSIGSVALFGIGGKLPSQLSNLVTRGAIVILPSLANHHADADLPQLQRVYLNAQKLIFTGVLPIVIFGCVCARPLIQVWAGTAYIEAAAIMQWLLLAAFSLAVEYPSDLLLYARGEIKTAARIAAVESVANVVVSLILVSRYGAVGLAAGTALTHLVINAFWYTPAACAAAELQVSKLLKAAISDPGWPYALLIFEVVTIFFGKLVMPPVAVLILTILGGVVYLAIWGFKTAIPMLHLKTDMVD